MELVKQVYQFTDKYPQKDKFSLVDQLRRAGISVPSYIAKACERTSCTQTAQFIKISLRSLCELKAQLLILKLEIHYNY